MALRRFSISAGIAAMLCPSAGHTTPRLQEDLPQTEVCSGLAARHFNLYLAPH